MPRNALKVSGNCHEASLWNEPLKRASEVSLWSKPLLTCWSRMPFYFKSPKESIGKDSISLHRCQSVKSLAFSSVKSPYYLESSSLSASLTRSLALRKFANFHKNHLSRVSTAFEFPQVLYHSMAMWETGNFPRDLVAELCFLFSSGDAKFWLCRVICATVKWTVRITGFTKFSGFTKCGDFLWQHDGITGIEPKSNCLVLVI